MIPARQERRFSLVEVACVTVPSQEGKVARGRPPLLLDRTVTARGQIIEETRIDRDLSWSTVFWRADASPRW